MMAQGTIVGGCGAGREGRHLAMGARERDHRRRRRRRVLTPGTLMSGNEGSVRSASQGAQGK